MPDQVNSNVSFDVAQAVQPLAILGIDAVAGDDENLIVQTARVEVFQHREHVLFAPGQEWVGSAVELRGFP